MDYLEKIGRCTSIILLILCILGLYFYLDSPDEHLIVLNSINERKIFFKPYENITVYLLPFEREELIEYHVVNFTGFLLNRTICINLEVKNHNHLAFSLMNLSQFQDWKSNSDTLVAAFHNFTNINFEFSPKNPWSPYFLLLKNNLNSNITLNFNSEQLFLLKIFNYKNNFNWLKLSSFFLLVSLFLQYKFKIIPENLLYRFIYTVIPRRYRKFVTRIPPIFFTVFCIILFLTILFCIYISYNIDKKFTFINQYWKDNYYRMCIEITILTIIIEAIFIIAYLFWFILHCPIVYYYYKDIEQKKEHDKIFITFLNKYLLNFYSIIFYLLNSAWFVFIFKSNIKSIFLIAFLTFSPFLIYISYLTTLTENKVNKKIYKSISVYMERNFEFYKASFGSTLILSLIIAFFINLSLFLLKPVSQFILDNGILTSNINREGLLKSAIILKDVKEFIPVFVYYIPLSILIVYYAIIAFTVILAYLQKSIINRAYHKKVSNIIKKTFFDLIFFIMTFLSSLWLQSQLLEIKYPNILISLASSFIATSFKNYLQTLGKIFHEDQH